MARHIGGQTAIVTGASRGIGREIVRILLENGVNVVAVARGEYALEKLQEEMRVGKRLLAVACDIRDPLEVERLFEVATDHFERVDMLVNSAGTSAFAPIEEMELPEVHEIVDTNLLAVIYTCQSAFRHMKRRGGGQILNIAALHGVEGVAHAAAYCASKWGVVGLSEALRLEGRPHGIRVSVVSPGPTRAETTDEPAAGKGRALQPETVAEAVYYMLTLGEDAQMTSLVLRHDS